MMNERSILRDHGEAGRWRTSLLGLAVLVVALIGALLVSTSTAGSDEPAPVYGPSGTLDFFANASDGDGFGFTPADPTLEEMFSTNNKSKLSESGDNLVVFTPTGPESGQLPYVGLKDHEIGVRSKGEGGGTPASRIDGDETLTITLGPDVPGDYAWFAQIAVSAKFNADGQVRALDPSRGSTLPGGPGEIDTAEFACSLSDCGPDSGGDRILLELGNRGVVEEGEEPTLFTQVEISVTNDGAASLIDDEPAGFNTYFEIVEEFDGELDCNEVTGAPDGEVTGFVDGVFTRLDAADAELACGVKKLFNFDVVDEDGVTGPELSFEPNDAGPVAVYRGDITLAASPATDPTEAGFGDALVNHLEYDADGPATERDFVPMQWCIRRPVVPDENVTFANGDLYFPEYGSDLFPTVVGLLPDLDEESPTSCIVAFSSEGAEDVWVVYAVADPRYR